MDPLSAFIAHITENNYRQHTDHVLRRHNTTHHRTVSHNEHASWFPFVSSNHTYNRTYRGKASWYGNELRGHRTASSEPFNPGAYTAAHRTLPFGSRVKVCYKECVTVRINDRGPALRSRIIDLSRGAAQAIGLRGVGVVSISEI